MQCNSSLFVYFTGLLISYQIYLSESAPKDVEDKLCPGTSTYIRDDKRIFSSLGQRCSVENEAYLLGAIYSKYSTGGKLFDKGSIDERWTNMAYLDASSYDGLGNPTPPPTTAPSCIFNERLAMQQSPSGLGIKVGLSCNPFELYYCRREYDDSLSLKDYCDCNYLYSVKETLANGTTKCVAKAGVPCTFNQSPSITDPFLKLPSSFECHSSLVCKVHKLVDQRRMYKKAFHGFGINPIAYEYMVQNAEGYCDCNDTKHKINVMNECILESKAITWYPRVHNVLSLFLFMCSRLL